MLESNTVLYDTMDSKFESMFAKDPHLFESWVDSKTKMTPRELGALHFANETMIGIGTAFVEKNHEIIKEGYSARDLDLLRERFLAGYQSFDKDRIRAADHDYFSTAFRNFLNIVTTPFDEEKELDEAGQTTELWTETMSYFRQIQTFYELKVTADDVFLLG